MELTYKHEKPLFRIAVVLSILFWLLLILGTFGIALIYILFGYLFFLFAHSAFISYLKGTGVKVTAKQYPDLHERVIRCCNKIGLEKVPDVYVLRTDFFNALATRFLGRHFVVLFSDVIDALEAKPDAIDFYIGHELGHIHRKHLLWGPVLMPASILPVLGAALSRAEEYTCDRYGAACCKTENDIKVALAAIAAGDTRWKSISINAYVEQIEFSREFWMSLNELTGDYPWLTKRMASAVAFSRGKDLKHPSRHKLAWFLSLFIPRFGGGGIVSLMITIAMIGVIAAIAIPAYNEYLQKAQFANAYQSALPVKEKISNYVVENKAWPTSLKEIGYQTEYLSDTQKKYQIGIYENGAIGIEVGVAANSEPQYIVLEPSIEEGYLKWRCYGQNLAKKSLPKECQ